VTGIRRWSSRATLTGVSSRLYAKREGIDMQAYITEGAEALDQSTPPTHAWGILVIDRDTESWQTSWVNPEDALTAMNEDDAQRFLGHLLWDTTDSLRAN
jgi:hypothetical protein